MSRGFWELLLLLFNSAVRPAETGERSCRGDFPDESLGARLNAEDFVNCANGQVSGERPRVDFGKLSSFSILLPPTAEQERIINRLNAALSGVERAGKASRRALERLQRY